MKTEVSITLEGDPRPDGSVYVHSPNVPLFHVVAPSISGWVEWALPILKDHVERNLGVVVQMRHVPAMEGFGGGQKEYPALPAHVIAEMTGDNGDHRSR